jgi:hypothetical protein
MLPEAEDPEPLVQFVDTRHINSLNYVLYYYSLLNTNLRAVNSSNFLDLLARICCPISDRATRRQHSSPLLVPGLSPVFHSQWPL